MATLWLGLTAIVILYLAVIVRMHPANFFGITQDDTIYFSSAKSLAAGGGYVLPDLPGAPPATKYPILYPWILSWVWRWNPSFPANLGGAIGISVAFGLAYILLAFSFLRRLTGMGSAETLLLTLFCALQPAVLFYSATVNSDMLFAATALAAMLLADRATERDASLPRVFACAFLASFTILLRVLGIPIALGILAAALARRAVKQAMIFAFCMVAPVFWLAWQAVASAHAAKPAGFDSAGPGFRQTWIYYTSYFGFRKLSMLNPHLVLSVLLNQVIYLFVDLPGYFLSPLFRKNIPLLFVCTCAILWMVFAGLALSIRRDGWRPIHFAFLLTVGAVFAWDYPEVNRFLLPFLPLLAASLWLAGKDWTMRLVAAMRASRSTGQRVVVAAGVAALGLLAIGVAWNFAANKDRAQQRQASLERAALLAEKRQAYDWVRQHAPENARAVAGEDGVFYLYTGRQAMAHIALRRAGAYDPIYMHEDLAHMTDVAAAIGASYWLASPDDSDKQWVEAKPFLAQRFEQIERKLPELFRSSGGRVRIYGLGCLQNPGDSGCPAASDASVPAGHLNASR